MAASTAILDVGRYSLGDKILKVVRLTGGTTITAASVNLTRIETCWFQDIDDANPIQCSAYAGTSITFEEITAAKTQLCFIIGIE
jgi:hypothetical protein